jgi:hypothetical protein
MPPGLILSFPARNLAGPFELENNTSYSMLQARR